MAKKTAFQQRSADVKQAHAACAKRPGFHEGSPARQMREVQQEVRKMQNARGGK